MMTGTKEDTRKKMYIRIDPILRREFRSELMRRGQQIEDRVSELIRRDFEELRRETIAASC